MRREIAYVKVPEAAGALDTGGKHRGVHTGEGGVMSAEELTNTFQTGETDLPASLLVECSL